METVTVITTTRCRSRSFGLLADCYLPNQTRQPDQWIVVCAGCSEKYTVPPNCEFIVRDTTNDVRHNLSHNLETAIDRATGDFLLIMEDDEVYFPTYIETFCEWLREYPLVGEGGARYLNLRYTRFAECENTTHASLCQTAFRREVIESFRHVLHEKDDVYYDIGIWDVKAAGKYVEGWKGPKKVYPRHDLVVSLKGLWTDSPDGKGLAVGHNPYFGEVDDRNIARKWLRQYACNYFDD